MDEADAFISKHADLNAKLIILNSTSSKTALDKKLLAAKKGSTIKEAPFTYKIISDSSIWHFRTSYIFLSTDLRSFNEMDSIRNLILQQYQAGVAFSILHKQYNMDGNQKAGDTGFFDSGMMVPAFEAAVKNHKKGDIFKVDIQENKWYYVVKKTFDNQVDRQITYIKINNQ